MRRLTKKAVLGAHWAVKSFFSTYTPQPMPAWVGVALSSIVSFAAIVRGLDLVFQVPAPPRPDGYRGVNIAVDYLGQGWWGACILAAGLCILVSLLMRRSGPLLISHAFGAGAYFGYGIALFQGVVLNGGLTGWRFVGTAVTGFALHSLRCIVIGKEIRQNASVDDLEPTVMRRGMTSGKGLCLVKDEEEAT